MYHHWKLQKSRDPCGEMSGFTRLLTNHRGADDGRSYANEIPTVVVKELSGMEARGYVVANRPYSMMQFVEHPEFKKRIVEDYVYIAETDHVLLRPLPNLATETVPAAFNFGCESPNEARTLSCPRTTALSHSPPAPSQTWSRGARRTS